MDYLKNISFKAYYINILNISVFLAACLLISGCASMKVDTASVNSNFNIWKPSRIYVKPFETNGGEWNVDRSGQELADFKTKASQELQRMMVKRFEEIAPSYNCPDEVPNSGFLVVGQFTRVNQGSRALRMFFGFGAGGTKVETVVSIYDLSYSKTEPAVTFKTTGGSNAQPGLLTAPEVYVAGVPTGYPLLAAGLNGTGLEDDWERTAREIRNFMIARMQ